ncbi:MFS transporter, partial [bacterium]|nr:MFS transporter [bacterium]
KRPKLRDVPPGSNLLTTGFKQLAVTSRVVFRDYSALKWFMIALLFSPEAGSGVFLAIAVTFLTFFVEMNVQEIAIVSIIMLFSNIPGALMSKKMCKVINPLNSFRMAELFFAAMNGFIGIFVTGSTQRDKNLVYLFASLIGISFGWMFPSQKTLTVALIPKGQEFEIMGLISFFGQIIGWVPVFIFTALNEAGVSMRWGVSIISFFLLMSFLCTLGCGSYEDAIKSVEHTSEDYLEEFALRNSGRKGESSGEGNSTTKIAMTDSGRDA